MRLRDLRAILAALALVVITVLAMAGTPSTQPVDAASVNNQMVVIIPSTTVPGSSTITFNANGGSGSMTPQVFKGSITLTANAFTRAGYSFAGWAKTPTGAVAVAKSAV